MAEAALGVERLSLAFGGLRVLAGVSFAVRAALTKIHQNKTSGSTEAAQHWLADLKASDRFLEDIWGETAAGI